MTVQGSKNAVLPILASTILIAGKTTLRNCPDISDVDCMCRILQKIGATVTKTGHEICVDASGALQSRLPAEEVVRMRSSIVLTGALLGRLGQASFCDPGGCVIGDRPIDLHLKAFARFGCQTRREDDNFLTVFAKRLNGVQIPFERRCDAECDFMRGLCKGRNSADRLCKGTGGRFAMPLFKRCRGKDRRSRKQNDSN